MNRSNIPDALDLLLFKVMPKTDDPDLDIYLTADPELFLSRKAKEKIRKRAEAEKRFYEKSKKYSPVLAAIKRVAVVFLIVTSVAFASAMSVKAVREALWDIIVGWYEEYIQLDFTKENPTAENTTASAFEFEYKEPRLGEGYERYVIEQDQKDFGIEYEKDKTLIVYRQNLIDDRRIYTSNNDTVVSEIKIGDYDAFAFTFYSNGAEQNTIMWEDGIYFYSIGANLPLDELKAIAETIE
ncbi:MAG: DUF4367 domain-containing protein [Clostridia bacterium]|nr:DUF4367 domain-containing protein [Clostridia bacterium]